MNNQLLDKLDRANCFNKKCDDCTLLCKAECLNTADTHTIRYYISDLEHKYNDVKTQVLGINSKFSEGDFANGIFELINLCNQLESEGVIMKTTDIGFEKFEEDFHADLNTAFIQCTSSNKYTYEGRNLNLRLINATVEELVKELFAINDELDNVMYPPSGARSEELYKRKEQLFNELQRRILE